jgi:translocation and assembly module TamB
VSTPVNGSPNPSAPSPRRRRSGSFYLWSWLGGTVAASLLVAFLLIAGLLWYSSTPRFANMVRSRVVGALEDATGGRVELGAFHWSLRHLAVEVDNLTIHGLEGPGEVPYAHVDRLYVRARILAFIRPQVALNYLEADHPVLHLIVYPDGSTNQPRPRTRTSSNRSLADTIFNLQVGRTEVNDGVAIVNQRAIPFSLRANNLGVVVTYAPVTDHYLGELRVADLDFERPGIPALKSILDLQAEISRGALELRALHLTSGGSQLDASGSLDNFAHPQWKLAARGSVSLPELSAWAAIDGLRQGSAELNLEGQGTVGSQGTAAGQFQVQGNVRLRNAAFQTSYLVLNGLSAAANVRISPDEIALDGVSARLPEGGTAEGSARFLHWSGSTAAGMPAGSQSARPRPPKMTASIRARVRRMGLPAVLRMVTIRRFQDLGFDTVADGTVNVDWTGSAEDLVVAAQLQLTAPPSPARGDLPLSGFVDAKYLNRGGTVEINQLQAHSEATNVQVEGRLAVYPISRPSSLQVHLSTGNLREFDHVLTDLGLAANGKRGVAAIPVELQGQAEFTGVVTGSLIDPDVKGRLTAANFTTVFSVASPGALIPTAVNANASTPPPPVVRRIHWDRLDASGEYSSERIAVQHADLAGNGATIEAQGQLEAHRIGPRTTAFDDSSPLDLSLVMHNASLSDLLATAGQSLPATGMANLQIHAGGSMGDLNGGGNVLIRGGNIAGEPYQTLNADVSFKGRQIGLTRLTLLGDGGRIVADGSYDWKAGQFLGNLDATGFELARIHRLQGLSMPIAGSLHFDAHASGSPDKPSVLAGVHLSSLTVRGQPVGGFDAVAHTQGDTVYFSSRSTLVDAQLEVAGQTVLHGDFDTKARLTVGHLDIAPFLQLFHVTGVTGRSVIGGALDLSGPAKDPKRFSGKAEIDQFSVTLENIALSSPQPLVISLENGTFSLARARIVGQDTNFEVAGTFNMLDDRPLALTGSGSVNMTLAETFDPNITSSGHVDFNVNAAGTLMKPGLTGQMRLTNVAIALNGLPNGISKLNGTLIFDQDRLDVQNLVGSTGGGQLTVGGFVTYQQGIYGDLTATGKDVRIRYSGVSATADTTMHLQGSGTNMLLTGNVLITRFIIGPNLDFALFAGGAGAAPPPNPNAPSNQVRLDIHITSSPQLDFQNSYAQLAGSVDLRIRGTVAQPSVLGRISITDGTANFAGTTYQLQRGDIYFTNPVNIDPIIDVDATTRISEYDVTVSVHGPSSHLTPTFRSEPPLPQTDVISLLALGRTQDEQQAYAQEQQQAGADSTSNALLGGALNAAVSSRMEQLFGVGSVKIDPTYLGNLGDSTARITVQQNVAHNVQLTYATNVNTTAEQFIQAQVNITETVSVVAIRDESEVFSLVLEIHNRFH